MRNTVKIFLMIMGLGFVLSSCFEEQEIGPVIGDSSTFVSAELLNDATANPTVLEPDNASDTFEIFEWTKSNFGVNIPINYSLQISSDVDFTDPIVLETTAGTTASITEDDLNDLMLEMGLTPYEQSDVWFRVASVTQIDTLYSAAIQRSATGYRLSECGDYCTVGIIGSATPGSWGTDTDMRLADASGADRSTWTVTLYLNVGEVKFRANDGWDINWGEGGVMGGPNIQIGTAGYYKVTFNDKTGEASFTSLAAPTYTSVGVIGDATPGGWGADTDLTQNANDPHVWEGTVTLGDGEIKFRANDSWDVNWGSDTYPSGYAVGNGPNIPVEAGTYSIWFNDVSGRYMIMNDGTKYTSVGIIGSATANGWDSDTDLIKSPINPYEYSARITLSDGEGKFRANDSWDNNWGGSGFPTGIGSKNGPNIPVPGGTYVVSFNSGTGEYRFLK